MNFVTYQFDSPTQFYAELKELLDGGGFYDSPEAQVGAFVSLIVLYQESNDMWITYHVLLYAGKEFPKVYHWMLKSEFFAKLKYQILQQEGKKIHPLALNLMYEMCRVQTLKPNDLALADEAFLNYLLDLVEHTRTDDAELLNYSIIKLLLVFNEQYMLHMSNRTHYTQAGTQLAYSGNPLLAVLTDRPGRSCTFGENLIYMLNRAEETALQMLILKLLYLLFTSPSLYDFFYTNDLHVLVDVVIRELWDLPAEEESLRHAYLRVMGPLLTNTPLKKATYKRAEIVRLLRELGGGDLDSTLRRQLQEQARKEQLLEQERALHTKLTFRDRESSHSSSTGSMSCSTSLATMARWASDRSACSSPALSFDVDKKRKDRRKSEGCHSKLSMDSNSSDSLQVPGQVQVEAAKQYYQQQHEPHPSQGDTAVDGDGQQKNVWSESPEQEHNAFIRAEQAERTDEPKPRAASPTTQRLVERVLREWLDNEMRNGAGTTGVGLSVRGVTDQFSAEAVA